MRDDVQREQQLQALISELQQALKESFRIREAAEALSQAAADLAASTPPERRTKVRPPRPPGKKGSIISGASGARIRG